MANMVFNVKMLILYPIRKVQFHGYMVKAAFVDGRGVQSATHVFDDLFKSYPPIRCGAGVKYPYRSYVRETLVSLHIKELSILSRKLLHGWRCIAHKDSLTQVVYFILR